MKLNKSDIYIQYYSNIIYIMYGSTLMHSHDVGIFKNYLLKLNSLVYIWTHHKLCFGAIEFMYNLRNEDSKKKNTGSFVFLFFPVLVPWGVLHHEAYILCKVFLKDKRLLLLLFPRLGILPHFRVIIVYWLKI